jgi:hypothetical protein
LLRPCTIAPLHDDHAMTELAKPPADPDVAKRLRDTVDQLLARPAAVSTGEW